LQITGQPADATALEGSSAGFAVKALNARRYQWQRLVSGAWQDLAAQQADVLQLPAVGMSDSGTQFRVQVRGDTETLISAAATLTVTRKPQAAAIAVPPASLLLADGDSLSWSVTATGTDLSYQWQRSRDGLAWSDVAGATASQWSPGQASLADNGLRVRVVVANTLGSVTSAVASLEVYPAPALPTFTVQPVDVRVQSGQTASFEAQVLGQPAPTLQWQRSSNGTQWEDVPQAQSARLQVAPVSAKDDGGLFRLSASNRAGQVFSQVARLTIQAAAPALSWQSEPQSLQVGIGQDAVFTAQVAAGAAATLQWQFSRDAGKTWQSLTGASDARLVIASASSREAGNWYRAQASNEVGQIISRAAQLQLDARLQMRLLLGDGRGRGHRDGPLLDAKMDEIGALAQDAQGHLYFTDSVSHVVRKIDFGSGRVVTLAGSPYEPGTADGAGAAARFNRPVDLAVNQKGQVFVVDVRSQRIRSVGPSGQVITVVSLPDPLHGQQLTEYSRITVHPVSGELYYGVGCSIYRVPGNGPAELWAGAPACAIQADGDRSSAVWWRVGEIGFDADGTLLAEDGGKLRRVLPSGKVETLGDWRDWRRALDFKRPRRASDGALYAVANNWLFQTIVYAYVPKADGSAPVLEWDAVNGRIPGAEVVAGALNMEALPFGSKALRGVNYIAAVSVTAGGITWVSHSSNPALWPLDRDGQAVAPNWPTGNTSMDGMLMLPDQALVCHRTRNGSYGNELVSIAHDGSQRVLATWPNDDASADMGAGYCNRLLWDVARGRVFEAARGSSAVYDLKSQKLLQASDLGYAFSQGSELLAIFPNGDLLTKDYGGALRRLMADGKGQVLAEQLPFVAAAGAIDQASTVFLLDRYAGRVFRLKAGGALEWVAGSATVNSTEAGSTPSWRDARDLYIWGPDQLLIRTPTELTVLDVPSGVDCGCTPPAKAALARKVQMLRHR